MKILNRTIAVQVLILLVFTIIGCGSDDTDVEETNSEPASIEIQSESNYSGSLNDIFQLTAIVKDVLGNNLTGQVVSWISSNPTVALISDTGSLRLISEGQTTITASLENITDSKTISVDLLSSSLRTFTIAELSDEFNDLGVSDLVFLDEETMLGTYVELNIGESTSPSSMDGDQVYYFVEGEVIMNIEGQVLNISAESAVFVAANSAKNIVSVGGSAKIIIMELKAEPAQSQSPFSVFTRAQMEAPRNPNQNIWNPFLNRETVTFGLYMLPEALGGDSRLVHNFDELNIITRGSSRFQTDDGDVEVMPGSIVFVKEGNGHWFNSLDGDHDILILWNK